MRPVPRHEKQAGSVPALSKKEQKADVCESPSWRRGYLAKEVKFVKGKRRLKRVIASLDTCNWIAAEQEVARLYERGALPAPGTGIPAANRQAVTVRHAAERYLESRKDGSLNPIEENTYNHYASLLNQRLIPAGAHLVANDPGLVELVRIGNAQPGPAHQFRGGASFLEPAGKRGEKCAALHTAVAFNDGGYIVIVSGDRIRGSVLDDGLFPGRSIDRRIWRDVDMAVLRCKISGFL